MNEKLGRQRQKQKDIRSKEERCIYCSSTGSLTIEHMPPLVMFKQRQRPKGLEFGVCLPCNNGTRGADLVASFLSKIDVHVHEGSWQFEENKKQRAIIEKRAPGFLAEIFRRAQATPVLWRSPGGIVLPRMMLRANGPITRAYLNVFCAKFGMALYRHHIGVPLPLDGIVRTAWFSNGGLNEQQVHAAISVLPGIGGLWQGKLTSAGQFSYIYNTDEKSIVMAMASFHAGLHTIVLATSNSRFGGIDFKQPTENTMRPGELLSAIPQSAVLSEA